jgi:chromate transporter
MNPGTGRRHVSASEAFRFWLKLGFISFGGPAGQISIMHRELVERRRWISEQRFLHALNYCMLLPGPEAQQLATYIGWLLHRTWGGLIAGGLFVLPSVFILLGLSYVYAMYGEVPLVAAALSGFKPVVIAVVIEAVLKIGRRALLNSVHVVLAAAAFTGIYVFHVPFPVIVLAAALAGLIGARVRPDVFAAHRRRTVAAGTPAIAGNAPDREPLPIAIDDNAPLPLHTRPSRARVARVAAIGMVLWLVPMIGLSLWRGAGSLHVQEFRFFTQAALVTFGGAYSVLAYVTQAAAETYGWVTHAQSVDGLALAETTPGPLIMVLQFVGYMAAWNHPEGMTSPTSALVGGLVTTYATFLPSFLFIFLGAPYIEVLRGNRHLAGALAAVTAAVVGVILNLAIVFGTAVLWPPGAAAWRPDWFAVLLTVAAVVAAVRFKVDIVWLVLAGGLVGVSRLLLA